jgi:hypothetical protein
MLVSIYQTTPPHFSTAAVAAVLLFIAVTASDLTQVHYLVERRISVAVMSLLASKCTERIGFQ